MIQSDVKGDLMKIEYFEKINKHNEHKYNENLVQLMQMGFTDYEKNLAILTECNNDLMSALQQLLAWANDIFRLQIWQIS